MSEQLSDDEKRIQELWKAAVEPLPNPERPRGEKGLGFRRSFQFNLKRAVDAAAQSIGLEKAMEHPNPHDPSWILKAGAQAPLTGWAVMRSLCEAMTPIVYVVAVILSQSEEGMTEADLEDGVNKFLTDPDEAKFAW